ncbi:hypothetical protein [Sphingobacterium sp. SYP-B4668]|uniref:hypothetical protein n=1 Tax=Sphingobacterium sp. SYP-B4668 TaxID=2996035 RepID=UPI0022DCF3BA|nr:hypothetical protein [Sphingobacterium sp. SYP-B4668]
MNKKNILVLLVLLGLTFTFLFTSCKKEDSYEELSRIADLKLQEAVKLTQDRPCGDIDEWSIETLYYRYVPIHPSFKQEYENLKAEYTTLRQRADKAFKGPVPYNTALVDIYTYLPPHFGLRCVEGKMKVMMANDLSLSEINTRLEQLLPEILNFFKEESCSDNTKWHILTIRKDCEFIPLVTTQTPNFRVFGEKMERYSQLYQAKRNLDTTMNCLTVNDKPAKGVVCENGKPVLQY